MDEHSQAYGDLIRLDPGDGTSARVLGRVPLGTSATGGGITESFLQDLLFRFPETLPIAAIDTAYAGAVPICRELATSAGYVDALYVNSLGRLTLAEFKLWRNPQARREVIGQILDYTKELASWNYEDLQREASRAVGERGNVLYELVRRRSPEIDEAAFVDNVTRHLKRGEFLLLIIGDGIWEGVESIVDFVQRHSGLHFNLALVEAALYRDNSDHLIVQPRVLARTEIVHRFVVENGLGQKATIPDDGPEPLSDHESENLRFWTAVLDDFEFADTAVDVPAPTKEATLYVKVRGSGYGDWGLWFGSYLFRKSRLIGCYLARREGMPAATRIYEQVHGSLDDLRGETGDDLTYWHNSQGRPRIGFRRETRWPFVSDDDSDFRDAVSWMRDHLERLVSALHPRLQHMIPRGD